MFLSVLLHIFLGFHRICYADFLNEGQFAAAHCIELLASTYTEKSRVESSAHVILSVIISSLTFTSIPMAELLNVVLGRFKMNLSRCRL